MDEQARADALADAETLWRVAREIHGSHFSRSNVGRLARAVRYNGALRSFWRMRSAAELEDDAQRIARHAHAAFRAVPGLRG